jgi:serine/threonine-protein kinase
MREGALLNSCVGEYRLIDFLGAGGMGEVYRAVHSKIGRVAAVKILNRTAQIPGSLERFLNEARIQARLSHPNIAALYDFLELNGQPCIVMEYVDGHTLDQLIRSRGALPLQEAIRIFRAIVEAVAYIHSKGIIHRDIKPNNIKINSAGQVKLLDFGIAKSEDVPKLTATGSIIGTVQYLSPEQIEGHAADFRSDIWALGVLLYEMVSGRLPFEATTIASLCGKILKADYAPPPSIPAAVEAIIARCLKKNPSSRYQSTQEILQDIDRLQATDPTSVERPAKAQPAWNRLALSSAAAALAILALVGLFAFRESPPLQVEPPTAQTNAEQAKGNLRTIRINTLEGQAEVYRDGQFIGMTPCYIQAQLGERVVLTLKRNGFSDERVEFLVTEAKKEYTIVMKPIVK